MRSSASDQLSPAWWVEINTSTPHCTYYFGPFDSQKEARVARGGYVEDLYQERARDIVARIKWCQPQLLTIVDQDRVNQDRVNQDRVNQDRVDLNRVNQDRVGQEV